MRILVTGATGVIGRRAVPLLIAAGHEVTAIGRSRARLEALGRARVRTLEVDLFDPDGVRRAMAGHDAVINLATHIPGGMRAFLPGAWAETARIRKEGSAVLVDAALSSGVQRFVQESFAPIYPDRGAAWIGEEVPPAPASYNRSVLDAEASAVRFTRGGGIGVALRFAYFYGAGDPFTRDVFRSVRRGWLPMFGRPEAFFSMVHHEDAATAVAAAASLPAGVYNVVDDQPLTIARSLRISNRKLRAAPSWAPRYPSAREGWGAALASFADLEVARPQHLPRTI